MKRALMDWKRWRAVPVVTLALLLSPAFAQKGSWQGIEPFKSRRADVLQVLGTPISDNPAGPLTFKVMGGTASVTFVDENFVRTKRLRKELEGTVLQIVLQHESSSDTPESLGLAKNRSFTREEAKQALIFRNLKDGIVYTFLNGNLKTTRYTFSEEQISRARR